MEKNKRSNVGIEILRIIMAFEVVIYHIWSGKVVGITHTSFDVFATKLISSYYLIAVPVFAIISFSFVDFEKVVSNKYSIKSRIIRVLTPHIFYTFFYALVLFICNNMGGLEDPINMANVKEQLLTGEGPFCGTMWFQISLFVITVIYIIIYRYIPKYADKIVILLGCISFYISINPNWIEYLQTHIFFPMNITVGRTVELIPMAAVGVIIRKLKTLNSEENKGKIFVIIGVIFALHTLIEYPDRIFGTYNGYAYAGINKIVFAVLTIILFNLLGQYIKFEKVKDIICYFSRYTMGVYGLHPLIAYFYRHTFISGNVYSFFDCVVIFIISMVVAILLSKINLKFIRNSVI